MRLYYDEKNCMETKIRLHIKNLARETTRVVKVTADGWGPGKNGKERNLRENSFIRLAAGGEKVLPLTIQTVSRVSRCLGKSR